MASRMLFSRSISLLGLSCLLGFVLAPAPVEAKSCKPRPECSVRITGTIWGSFTGSSWAGHALVQLGDDEPMLAAMVDVATQEPAFRDDGSFYGAEIITFTFNEEDSFQVVGAYNAYPGATPNLFTYVMKGPGKIENPTGVFKEANLTGSVTICGPFVFPFGEEGLLPGPAWIAQVKGKVRLKAAK